jgi:hypothetical protein
VIKYCPVFTKNFVKHRPIGPPSVIILQAQTIFYWPKIFSAKEDYSFLAPVAVA